MDVSITEVTQLIGAIAWLLFAAAAVIKARNTKK
ncbi:hypothetical protein MCAMS1_02867 [biofilm metagenome]